MIILESQFIDTVLLVLCIFIPQYFNIILTWDGEEGVRISLCRNFPIIFCHADQSINRNMTPQCLTSCANHVFSFLSSIFTCSGILWSWNLHWGYSWIKIVGQWCYQLHNMTFSKNLFLSANCIMSFFIECTMSKLQHHRLCGGWNLKWEVCTPLSFFLVKATWPPHDVIYDIDAICPFIKASSI